MSLPTAMSLLSGLTRTTRAALAIYPVVRIQALVQAAVFPGVAAALLYRGSRQDVYNVLWALVFGFATLNILSLAARRFEPTRRGLSFGELLAVMVVLISIFSAGMGNAEPVPRLPDQAEAVEGLREIQLNVVFLIPSPYPPSPSP